MLKTVIILAAGLGTRLQPIAKGKPKLLVKLEGKPLLYYPLTIASSIGVSEACIIIPPGWRSEVAEIARGVLGSGSIAIVENHEPREENGLSLFLALECFSFTGKHLVSMTDHLYTGVLAMRVASSSLNGDYVVGGDIEASYVDHEEATKLLAQGGLIARCSKQLKFYSHIDVGVQAVNAHSLVNTIGLEKNNWRTSLSEIINLSVRRGLPVLLSDVTGLPWTEIDTPEDYNKVLHGDRRIVFNLLQNWLKS